LRTTLDQGLYLETISRPDPDQEFALADAFDATHGQVTAWAALRSLEQAGLIDLRQIAPVVNSRLSRNREKDVATPARTPASRPPPTPTRSS
jgi:hypothetical protein